MRSAAFSARGRPDGISGRCPTDPSPESAGRPRCRSSSTSPAAAPSRRATSPTSTAAERAELVSAMGLPGFRAKQLSTHYFARLVDDPAEMTDLPAGQRDELVAALLPR